MPPFFSVVVPMYNRAGLIARALDSVLAQDYGDFEIVVVDDGSVDGSPDVVRRYTDERVRLLVHERNQGRCPARNTGMAASRGEWFVFLDSDDELLPGALAVIAQRAKESEPDVVGLRFMCRDEEGRISPDPPHRDELWSYGDFARWMERMIGHPSEAMACARAATFPAVRYPEGHAEEGQYNLDLARAGRVRACADVVRTYHHDAPNQITRPRFQRLLEHAPDNAANVEAVLAAHGEILRTNAPNIFAAKLREGALAYLLAGRRRDGLRYARQYVAMRGVTPRLAAITVAGMIGSWFLAALQIGNARLTRWRRA